MKLSKIALNNLNRLMKEVLNKEISSKKRAEVFNKMYYRYIKEDSSGEGWMKTYDFIRSKNISKLNEKKQKEYGLKNNDLIKSQKYLKEESRKIKKLDNKERFVVSYTTAYSIIKKIIKPKDKILEIGYGDYPFLIEILNSKGYNTFGLEPETKIWDNKITFKSKFQDINKKLIKEYDIILANLVFCANFMNSFGKRYSWELKNKEKIIKLLTSLLKKKGYLILHDDIGSIFTEKELKKYFKIIFFEKDINYLGDKEKSGANSYSKFSLLIKK